MTFFMCGGSQHSGDQSADSGRRPDASAVDRPGRGRGLFWFHLILMGVIVYGLLRFAGK